MAHGIVPSRRLRPRAGFRQTGRKAVLRPVGAGADTDCGDRVGHALCRFAEAAVPLTRGHVPRTVGDVP
ncbi:hypothetical protein GCM10010261_36590 [Streptomyces pilosus]|nr:hypothetical protein GCM10010261_36590 [Streptomyces pilosus]